VAVVAVRLDPFGVACRIGLDAVAVDSGAVAVDSGAVAVDLDAAAVGSLAGFVGSVDLVAVGCSFARAREMAP
jgi:hypothetical protein